MKTLAALLVLTSLNVFGISYTYGSYEGDGVGQSITGVGFTPDVLLIKRDGGSAGVIATSAMPSGEAKSLSGTSALVTGLISSLDVDGFTVATNSATNADGDVYHFIAWEANTSIDVGFYTGDVGSVAVGYRPAMVWILGDEGVWPDYAAFAMDSHGGDSGRFQDGSQTEDIIGSFTATGFNIGSDANTASKDYYYVTFKDDADVVESTYSASGADGYEVTGPGLEPQFVMIQNDNNVPAYFRTPSFGTNESIVFGSSSSETAAIKSFTSNGFTLGSNANVNNVGTNIYFAAKGGSVLPVELIYFNARLMGSDVRVKWKTGAELNSSHFLVERSNDGLNFEIVGEVPTAGNSTMPLEYEFVDFYPNSGNNYYRLKQVDYDGAFEYFNTVVVNSSTGTEMTQVNVYPNPVLDDLNFYFDSKTGGNYEIEIYNQLGSKVYSTIVFGAVGGNEVNVEVLTFDPGYYIAQVKGPEGSVAQVKFYKRL